MLACAQNRRHPLRRVRWLRGQRTSGANRTHAKTRSSSSRHPAVLSLRGSSNTNRCLTKRKRISDTLRNRARLYTFSVRSTKSNCWQKNEANWHDLMHGASPADLRPRLLATDPLYILYTSGTTGQPKGVVRDNGGHAVALKWTMRNIYDVRETGHVLGSVRYRFGSSDTPYIVYGPLLNGSTTVLYEGKPVGTPDAGAFGRVISENNVSVLFTAPTAMRSIKKEDPDGVMLERYSRDHLQSVFLAGERTDPNTHEWAERIFGVPVIDHWWQTENRLGNLCRLPRHRTNRNSPRVRWETCSRHEYRRAQRRR